jgi:hypothetical protein
VSEFGDYEPEDAWDPGDPIPLLIDNLLKRIDALDETPPDAVARYRDIITLIDNYLRPWVERRNAGNLSARQALRVTQLQEDLAFVRNRDDLG